MRVLLFFDLPMNTPSEKREYVRFRKHLLKHGFFMMQQSVYCKLVLNMAVAKSVVNTLHNNTPDTGLIQILIITEKQYEKMILLLGKFETEVLNTDQRLVIL